MSTQTQDRHAARWSEPPSSPAQHASQRRWLGLLSVVSIAAAGA